MAVKCPRMAIRRRLWGEFSARRGIGGSTEDIVPAVNGLFGQM